MNYSYKCSECERNGVSEYPKIISCSHIYRDSQICPHCNNKLERIFEASSRIVIPGTFSNGLDNRDVLPANMEGLSPAKGY